MRVSQISFPSVPCSLLLCWRKTNYKHAFIFDHELLLDFRWKKEKGIERERESEVVLKRRRCIFGSWVSEWERQEKKMRERKWGEKRKWKLMDRRGSCNSFLNNIFLFDTLSSFYHLDHQFIQIHSIFLPSPDRLYMIVTWHTCFPSLLFPFFACSLFFSWWRIMERSREDGRGKICYYIH